MSAVRPLARMLAATARSGHGMTHVAGSILGLPRLVRSRGARGSLWAAWCRWRASSLRCRWRPIGTGKTSPHARGRRNKRRAPRQTPGSRLAVGGSPGQARGASPSLVTIMRSTATMRSTQADTGSASLRPWIALFIDGTFLSKMRNIASPAAGPGPECGSASFSISRQMRTMSTR